MTPYEADFDLEGDALPVFATDFQEVKGQEHVKRALEVAAIESSHLVEAIQYRPRSQM